VISSALPSQPSFLSAADVGAIDFKDCVEHAAHILKHYGAGPGLTDDIDVGGKQVPFIICAELLESGRFRGGWRLRLMRAVTVRRSGRSTKGVRESYD
jgi:hypothetical protein